MRTALGFGLYIVKSVGLCFLACVTAEAAFWSLCLHGLALVGALPFVVQLSNQFVFAGDGNANPAFGNGIGDEFEP